MTSLPDLAELQRFDTPTICNAIELFDVRPAADGYMDRRIAACFPEMPPMVGYASTASFRSAAPAPAVGQAEAFASSLAQQQLDSFTDLPGPAVVVFQDLDDPPAGATFGDGMCLTYKTFGAAGLITSGAARDLDNVRALDFPCFSDGTMCGHGHCHIESIMVPVQVGGLTIYTGDLLHGDCNGVTTIPRDIAAIVPYACAEFLEAEAGVLNPLRDGSNDLARHAQAIADMQKRLGELKKELQQRLQQSS